MTAQKEAEVIIMYRNNFRTPYQQPQTRNNTAAGNGGFYNGRTGNGPAAGNNGRTTSDCGCGAAPAPASERSCGCSRDEIDEGCMPSNNDPISGMRLAMAYVPWQDFRNIYSEEEGWCRGTIFAQLDLEFLARRCN